MLEPIVVLGTVNKHKQLLLAAPIIVVHSPFHKCPPPARYVVPEGRPPLSPTDVLFYPHPTKRVVVKKISRAWLHALASFAGAPVGEVRALRHLQTAGPHPHVVPLLDVMVDDHFYYLLLPHADGGEPLPWSRTGRVAWRS